MLLGTTACTPGYTTTRTKIHSCCLVEPRSRHDNSWLLCLTHGRSYFVNMWQSFVLLRLPRNREVNHGVDVWMYALQRRLLLGVGDGPSHI